MKFENMNETKAKILLPNRDIAGRKIWSTVYPGDIIDVDLPVGKELIFKKVYRESGLLPAISVDKKALPKIETKVLKGEKLEDELDELEAPKKTRKAKK